MKKILLPLLAISLGFIGWRIHEKIKNTQTGSQKKEPPATAVSLQPLHRMDVRDVRVFTGSVLPRQQFVVAPKVAGRLEKLLVNIGEPVRNGDLVARLDDQEYRQQVEEARAALEVARAIVSDTAGARDLAERDFTRVQSLVTEKVASEAELDEARARVLAAQARHAVALAQIKQNEAALKASEVRLSYTEIRAAWEGNDERRVIGERYVDEGAMLKANEPIVSILDVHTVLAVLSVIERDYSRIRTGQTAAVTTDAWPGLTFTGSVVRKAPLLKEASRQARVEVEVPNPDRRLAPGMFIRAEIPFASQANALVAPTAALVQRDGKTGVFLSDTDGRRARFVPVTPGIVNGALTEIVEPDLDGSVIVLGQHLLDDGASIRVTGQEDARP